MNNLKNISLKQYIEISGINFSESTHTVKKGEITEELIIEQFHVINKFHKILRDYRGYDIKNIDNKTGRLVEKYKMEIRLGKRYIRSTKGNNISDDFNDMLLKYIERSEECVLQASRNYVDLIKRSMKSGEICLEDCYFDNVYENEHLFIRDASSICFDMIEIDGINLIDRIKVIKDEFDWEKLIHEYACIEKLNACSEEFMKALISYPSEVMKWFRRYVKDEEKFPKDYYLKKIKKAAKKDGKSII